jgi:hypothetical protein
MEEAPTVAERLRSLLQLAACSNCWLARGRAAAP